MCVNRALLLKGRPHISSARAHQVPNKASLQMPVQDDGQAGLGGYQLRSFNRGRRSTGATHVSHRAQKDAEAQASGKTLRLPRVASPAPVLGSCGKGGLRAGSSGWQPE